MITLWQAVLAGVVIGLLVFFYWITANRLDRLHRKVEASRTALDHQLLGRAAAVGDLALSGLVDPASSLALTTAAFEVREASDRDDIEDLVAGHLRIFSDERLSSESALSRVLREALDSLPIEDGARTMEDEAILLAVASACYKASLARRFHNDAVAQAISMRERRIVRYLKMAGRAPWPSTADFDDAPPASLIGRGG